MDVEKQLRHGWHCLLFGVRRSARYHCRRAHFYENIGSLLSILSIVFGGGAVFATRTDSLFVRFGGAVIALFSAFNIVLGFTKSAREHRDFESKYNGIEKEMAGCGASPTNDDLIKFTQRRLEIEEKEPAKMCGLDAMCHNDIIVSMGLDRGELVEMGWLDRRLVHFINFDPDKLKRVKDCIAPTNIPAPQQ